MRLDIRPLSLPNIDARHLPANHGERGGPRRLRRAHALKLLLDALDVIASDVGDVEVPPRHPIRLAMRGNGAVRQVLATKLGGADISGELTGTFAQRHG